jgi:sigma-B regulation protein RsbU (phosphoserine phosphatase)
MNTKIAVFIQDSKIFEALKAASNSYEFILNPKLEDFSKDHHLICDFVSFEKMKIDLEKIQKENLTLLSDKSDEMNMQLVEKYHLYHLIGLNEDIFASEVILNLNKLRSKKIWGLSHYVNESGISEIISLNDSKNINELMNKSLSHFDFKDYFSSPVEYIQVMANELISNSLYKGPHKKRAEVGIVIDRKGPVFLKGAELVQVTLGMDDRGVALSVQDSFGGLSYSVLIESLRRSFAEKTAMDKKDGAGLGLYLTFLHSNQFIINFRENYRTEVICIIDKNKRYKNYKQRIRSFHFFQEVNSEKTNAK